MTINDKNINNDKYNYFYNNFYNCYYNDNDSEDDEKKEVDKEEKETKKEETKKEETKKEETEEEETKEEETEEEETEKEETEEEETEEEETEEEETEEEETEEEETEEEETEEEETDKEEEETDKEEEETEEEETGEEDQLNLDNENNSIKSIIFIIKNKNNIDYNDDTDDSDDDNRKRKNNHLFKDVIETINKTGNKKQKINNEWDDFNNYFKESDNLLPIDIQIKSLDDLIHLGKTYDIKDKKRYVINLRALNKCVEPLIELNNMIGMKNIKEMIIDLIFYRLQNFEDNKEELWHLVIQGTPGSGKTEVAKIIGKLYYGLGITKKDKFTLVKRSDLIGKYLGHTARLTQEIFDNAKGGILFIDEAYSLGNAEKADSFSKECIDTINQNLTENKETIVFIAGYKDQLNESFFSYNPGLNRRFKMRMTVDVYNAKDLREIYIKKIKENNWEVLNNDLEKEIPLYFFEKNIHTFKYNGGDMENLWHFTKIVHSRRIFGKSHDLMKKITHMDIENAYKLYSENDEVKSRNENIAKYIYETMYC